LPDVNHTQWQSLRQEVPENFGIESWFKHVVQHTPFGYIQSRRAESKAKRLDDLAEMITVV
jgi:methylphosphotriester-DNA--protein-cysteine methyltransferase